MFTKNRYKNLLHAYSNKDLSHFDYISMISKLRSTRLEMNKYEKPL